MSAPAALAEILLDNPMEVGNYNHIKDDLNKRRWISLDRKKEVLDLYCLIPRNHFKDIFPSQENTAKMMDNLSVNLAITGRIAKGNNRRGWLQLYCAEHLATIYCSMIIRKVEERRSGRRSVEDSVQTLKQICTEVRQCVVAYGAEVSTSGPAARGRMQLTGTRLQDNI